MVDLRKVQDRFNTIRGGLFRPNSPGSRNVAPAHARTG
jgi:hypothetical protein